MKRNHIHTLIGTFLLAVVGLTSTGFTSAVGYCSMSRSSVCCCGEDMHSGAGAPAQFPTLTDERFSCFSVLIVGGFVHYDGTTVQEFASKSILPASHQNAAALVEPLPQIGTAAVAFPPAASGSPPGAKIFIRIGTLLI